MIKKIGDFLEALVDFIIEEKFFLMGLFLFTIICLYPVDYYIITGGGTGDIVSRVKVENEYKYKGSFNICFVHELGGTVASYLLSYVIPSWDRDKVSNYKYNDEESLEDVEFRNDLSLKESSSAATYWAYTLAGKKIKELDHKIFVVGVLDSYPTKLKVGDEILSIDNKKFNSIDEYKEIIGKHEEGDKLSIKVKRNGKEKTIESKLYVRDDYIMLGVYLEGYSTYKTDPKIEFKFRSTETGPSAGLITTLDIYNKLTKKDLTNSLKIAGTGTIEMDGTIGQIGGVKYKLLGAADDKMDIFLVPAGENYKEALKVKKDNNLKIKIISVKDINEAIELLEKEGKAKK